MQRTNIEWTDLSANPLKYRRKSDGKVVWGCVKTSPGCAHCYSEATALRWERGKLFNAKNMEELVPFLDEDELHQMLHRKTCGGAKVSGARCFVGDMTDLFGEWVPDELLDRLFAVFAPRQDVTFQVLTKRAERMREYVANAKDRIADQVALMAPSENLRRLLPVVIRNGIRDATKPGSPLHLGWPLPNVWLGVSVEDQAHADERIPLLLQTPAAVRFLSCEPLLGPLDVAPHLYSDYDRAAMDNQFLSPLPGTREAETFNRKIDWVIIGGESGHGARPCNVAWIRSILAQCKAAGVGAFVKQLGGVPIDPSGAGSHPIECECGLHYGFKDKKGGDPVEWPADLRVREWPEVVHA